MAQNKNGDFLLDVDFQVSGGTNITQGAGKKLYEQLNIIMDKISSELTLSPNIDPDFQEKLQQLADNLDTVKLKYEWVGVNEPEGIAGAGKRKKKSGKNTPADVVNEQSVNGVISASEKQLKDDADKIDKATSEVEKALSEAGGKITKASKKTASKGTSKTADKQIVQAVTPENLTNTSSPTLSSISAVLSRVSKTLDDISKDTSGIESVISGVYSGGVVPQDNISGEVSGATTLPSEEALSRLSSLGDTISQFAEVVAQQRELGGQLQEFINSSKSALDHTIQRLEDVTATSTSGELSGDNTERLTSAISNLALIGENISQLANIVQQQQEITEQIHNNTIATTGLVNLATEKVEAINTENSFVGLGEEIAKVLKDISAKSSASEPDEKTLAKAEKAERKKNVYDEAVEYYREAYDIKKKMLQVDKESKEYRDLDKAYSSAIGRAKGSLGNISRYGNKDSSLRNIADRKINAIKLDYGVAESTYNAEKERLSAITETVNNISKSIAEINSNLISGKIEVRGKPAPEKKGSSEERDDSKEYIKLWESIYSKQQKMLKTDRSSAAYSSDGRDVESLTSKARALENKYAGTNVLDSGMARRDSLEQEYKNAEAIFDRAKVKYDELKYCYDELYAAKNRALNSPDDIKLIGDIEAAESMIAEIKSELSDNYLQFPNLDKELARYESAESSKYNSAVSSYNKDRSKDDSKARAELLQNFKSAAADYYALKHQIETLDKSSQQYKEALARFNDNVDIIGNTVTGASNRYFELRNQVVTTFSDEEISKAEKPSLSKYMYEQEYEAIKRLYEAQIEQRKLGSTVGTDNDEYRKLTQDIEEYRKAFLELKNEINSNDLYNASSYTQAKTLEDEYSKQLAALNRQLTLKKNIETWSTKNERAAAEYADVIADITAAVSNLDTPLDAGLLQELDTQFAKIKADAQASGLTGRNPTDTEKQANAAAARALMQKFEELLAKAGSGAFTTYENEIDAVRAAIEKAINVPMPEMLKAARTQLSTLTSEFKSAGYAGANMFTSLDKKVKSLFQLFAGATILSQIKNQFQEAYNSITQLDAAFTNIAMTMPLTTQNMIKLKDQSIELARELGVSLSQVTTAASIYANAETSVDEIINRSRPTALLASAAGMDTSSAADLIQGALYQFEMEDTTDNLQRIVDVVESISASTGVEFKRSIQEISEAIKTSGAIAKSSGYSIEEYAAQVGALIEKTRKSGAEIANAQKMIFARLGQNKEGDATDEDISKAETAYKSIGIQLRSSTDEFREIPDVFEELNTKWATLTSTQKSYIAELSAGNRNRSVFLAMMDDYQNAIDLTTTALESQGFAEEANEIRLESYEAKLGQFTAAAQGFWNNFTDTSWMKGLLTIATSLVDVGDALVNGGLATVFESLFNVDTGAIGDWVDAFTKLQPMLIGLAASTIPSIVKELSTSESTLGSIFRVAKDIVEGGGVGTLGKARGFGELEAAGVKKGDAQGLVKLLEGKSEEERDSILNAANRWGFDESTIATLRDTFTNYSEEVRESFAILQDAGVVRDDIKSLQDALTSGNANEEDALEAAGLFGFSDDNIASLLEQVESAKNSVNEVLGAVGEDVDSEEAANALTNLFSTADGDISLLADVAAGLGFSEETINQSLVGAQEIVATTAQATVAQDANTGANQRNAQSERELTQAERLEAAARQRGIANTTADSAANTTNAATQRTLAATIRGTTKALWAQVAAWAATPAGMVAIAGMALSLLVNVFTEISQAGEKARQEIEETRNKAIQLTEEMQKARTEAAENTKALEDLLEQYTNLSDGVSKYGYNISLTSSEYEKYVEVVGEIADINPQLITGYNEQGVALVNLGKNLDDVIEKYRQMQIAEARTYVSDNAGTILQSNEDFYKDNFWANITGYQSQIAELEALRDVKINGKTFRQINPQLVRDVTLQGQAVTTEIKVSKETEEFIKELGSPNLYTDAVQETLRDMDLDVFESMLNTRISSIEGIRASILEGNIELFRQMLSTSENYLTADKQAKEAIDSLLSAIYTSGDNILRDIGTDVSKAWAFIQDLEAIGNSDVYQNLMLQQEQLESFLSSGDITTKEYYDRAKEIQNMAQELYGGSEYADVYTQPFDYSSEIESYYNKILGVTERLIPNRQMLTKRTEEYIGEVQDYLYSLPESDLTLVLGMAIKPNMDVSEIERGLVVAKNRLVSEYRKSFDFTDTSFDMAIETYEKDLKTLSGLKEKVGTLGSEDVVEMMRSYADFDWGAYGVTGEAGVGSIGGAIDALIDQTYNTLRGELEGGYGLVDSQIAPFTDMSNTAKANISVLQNYIDKINDVKEAISDVDNLSTDDILSLMDDNQSFDWAAYGVTGEKGIGDVRGALETLARKTLDELGDNIDNLTSDQEAMFEGMVDGAIAAKEGIEDLTDVIDGLKSSRETMDSITEDMASYGRITTQTLTDVIGKFPSLEAAATQYLAGAITSADFIVQFKEMCNQELKDYKAYLVTKNKYDVEYYKQAGGRDEDFILMMRDNYKVDLKNCMTYAQAKKEILYSTVEGYDQYFDEETGKFNQAAMAADGISGYAMSMILKREREIAEMFGAMNEALDNAFDVPDWLDGISEWDADVLDRTNEYLTDTIELYDQILEGIQAAADARIEAIDAEIEAIEKRNEEEQKEIELIKLRKQLEDARNNKVIREYHEGVGFVWAADQTAIAEAEEALRDAEVDAQIEALQTQKEAVENYAQQFADIPSDIENAKAVSTAMDVLGVDSAGDLLELEDKTLKQLASDYERLTLANDRQENAEKLSQYQALSPAQLQSIFGSDFIATSENLVNSLSGSNYITDSLKEFATSQKQLASAIENSIINNTNSSTQTISKDTYIENLNITYSGGDLEGLIKDAIRYTASAE